MHKKRWTVFTSLCKYKTTNIQKQNYSWCLETFQTKKKKKKSNCNTTHIDFGEAEKTQGLEYVQHFLL